MKKPSNFRIMIPILLAAFGRVDSARAGENRGDSRSGSGDGDGLPVLSVGAIGDIKANVCRETCSAPPDPLQDPGLEDYRRAYASKVKYYAKTYGSPRIDLTNEEVDVILAEMKADEVPALVTGKDGKSRAAMVCGFSFNGNGHVKGAGRPVQLIPPAGEEEAWTKLSDDEQKAKTDEIRSAFAENAKSSSCLRAKTFEGKEGYVDPEGVTKDLGNYTSFFADCRTDFALKGDDRELKAAIRKSFGPSIKNGAVIHSLSLACSASTVPNVGCPNLSFKDLAVGRCETLKKYLTDEVNALIDAENAIRAKEKKEPMAKLTADKFVTVRTEFENSGKYAGTTGPVYDREKFRKEFREEKSSCTPKEDLDQAVEEGFKAYKESFDQYKFASVEASITEPVTKGKFFGQCIQADYSCKPAGDGRLPAYKGTSVDSHKKRKVSALTRRLGGHIPCPSNQSTSNRSVFNILGGSKGGGGGDGPRNGGNHGGSGGHKSGGL